MAQRAFADLPFTVKGIQEYRDVTEALEETDGVFTGGGNTFLLVSQLYSNKLMIKLRERIFEGLPYLGTSAGTNIAGLTMQTTNDMPIVYPPSFKTLGVVPFNINPHYLDPDPKSTHKGESRETRIKEFHSINRQPVVGLREGSWLEVKADKITLKGLFPARIFKADQVPFELQTNSGLENLK
jgi:dipeptidase E